MTDQFPPGREREVQKNFLDESSALMDELAKLRRDIARESYAELDTSLEDPISQKLSKSDCFFDSLEKNKNDRKSNFAEKPFSSAASRPIYRYDLEHVTHNDFQYGNLEMEIENRKDRRGTFPSGGSEFQNDSRVMNNFEDSCDNVAGIERNSFYQPISEKTETKSRENQRDTISPTPKPNEETAEQRYWRYDDAPVVIPIRRKSSEKQGIPSTRLPSHPYTQHFQPDEDEADSLPWRFISRYENETVLNWVANISSMVIFLGWGAVACGVLVFIRSFFVSSTVWLSYGLPVLSLGAFCLILGIVLEVLSGKMQQINELKQSLTAQRILGRSPRKFDPPLTPGRSLDRMEQRLDLTHLPPEPNSPKEHQESDDIYKRLVNLRAEIEELIDECESP